MPSNMSRCAYAQRHRTSLVVTQNSGTATATPSAAATKATFYFSSFLGRPCGRRLASNPRRAAVRLIQVSSPWGVPRAMLCRICASSAAVNGSCT